MGAEHKSGLKENLGIKVPIGRTVVIASFLLSHGDPLGEHPNIDLEARTTAVWLTTRIKVDSQEYDFIIGPDGKASVIAIQIINGQTNVLYHSNMGMRKIEDVKRSETATFTNLPEGAEAQVVFIEYPERLKECYTVLRLPGDDTERGIETFSPFANKRNLISGMKNRGWSFFSKAFWTTRITDKTELPFGRKLHRPTKY